jgi:hypothetical protein
MQVLETYDLFGIINGEYTDVNDGRFLGISRSAGDISYFQISGSGIAMSNISLVGPGPSTFTLCGFPFVALTLVLRRGKSAR